MNKEYEFYIAGRTRNKEEILEICDIFDNLNISYYCFLKNDTSYKVAGLDIINENPEELMKKFENMELNSNEVKKIFENDMEAEKNSNKTYKIC